MDKGKKGREGSKEIREREEFEIRGNGGNEIRGDGGNETRG